MCILQLDAYSTVYIFMCVLFLELISRQRDSLSYAKAIIMITNNICSKKSHKCINSKNKSAPSDLCGRY